MVRTEEDTGYYSPGRRISRCARVLGALVNHSAVEVSSLKGGTWGFPFHKRQNHQPLPECKVISDFFVPLDYDESQNLCKS